MMHGQKNIKLHYSIIIGQCLDLRIAGSKLNIRIA